MEKSKRLMSVVSLILLVSFLCFYFAFPVHAEESNEVISVQVIQADSEKEVFEEFAKLSEESIDPRAAVVSIGIARNDSSGERCELFLNWKGTARYNGWRFKKVEISNGSALNPEIYDSIGTGASYKTFDVVSSSSGTVSLGTIDIPTSVDEVSVKFTSLQGSLSANTDWISVGSSKYWVSIK